MWSDYANLNFTEVATNGDIRVSWQVGDHGDGSPFDGLNGVLAHAFFPPPAGGTTAFAGDVHFDDAETWTMLERPVPSGQPMDLVTVAAQEIGHALGLGHSNVACALMNAFYTGSHRYLSQDDVDGIQSIYGNRTVVRTINLDCSGGTFFINNLPNGASVFWASSDNLIATVTNNNNQGIVSRVGNASGDVRITGTITLPCGTTVVEFIDIHIGAQAPTFVPYGTICSSVPFTLCANPIANSISRQWVARVGNSNVVLQETGDWCVEVPANTLYVDLFVTNNCGTAQKRQFVRYTDCGSFANIAVSPNPSSSQTNVTALNGASFSEIRIIDKLGNIRKQFKFAKETKSGYIDVSELPADIYTIQVFDGKKWTGIKFSKQ